MLNKLASLEATLACPEPLPTESIMCLGKRQDCHSRHRSPASCGWDGDFESLKLQEPLLDVEEDGLDDRL